MRDNHVLVYPSDATGCGMYRLNWPGQSLKMIGKPVTVSQRPPKVYVSTADQTIMGINIGTAKTVVFQRPGSYQMAHIIPILQKNGVKVVIDMDDSLSQIHPRNPAFRSYDPRVNQRINWIHAAKSCELADLVTVTTEGLAEEYGSHGRVVIIPNHIPERYLKIERSENGIPIIGWAGYTKTHVDDLRVTKGMINQVLSETSSKFAAYGDRDIFNELGIRLRAPHENWGFKNIMEYPKQLAALDIGLVPLQNSPFNEKKSWLKGLEYASVGVVPVVTPIGDYKNLIDLGAALPASTPKEWYDTVKRLVLDHDMRKELSDKVRRIATDWTIEGNRSKWWSAWENTRNESAIMKEESTV